MDATILFPLLILYLIIVILFDRKNEGVKLTVADKVKDNIVPINNFMQQAKCRKGNHVMHKVTHTVLVPAKVTDKDGVVAYKGKAERNECKHCSHAENFSNATDRQEVLELSMSMEEYSEFTKTDYYLILSEDSELIVEPEVKDGKA